MLIAVFFVVEKFANSFEVIFFFLYRQVVTFYFVYCDKCIVEHIHYITAEVLCAHSLGF